MCGFLLQCPKCHVCIEKNGGCNHMVSSGNNGVGTDSASSPPQAVRGACIIVASLSLCHHPCVTPWSHTTHMDSEKKRERDACSSFDFSSFFSFFFFFIFCSTGCYLFVVAECMVYMRVCHTWCFLAQPDSSWQTATFQQVCLVELKNSTWQSATFQHVSVMLKNKKQVLLTISISVSMFS